MTLALALVLALALALTLVLANSNPNSSPNPKPSPSPSPSSTQVYKGYYRPDGVPPTMSLVSSDGCQPHQPGQPLILTPV